MEVNGGRPLLEANPSMMHLFGNAKTNAIQPHWYFFKIFPKNHIFPFLRLSLTSLLCGVNYPSKGALNPVVKILKLVYTLELWHLFFKTLRPLYSKMEAAIQKRPMPSKSHMPGLSEMVRQPMIGSIKVPIWSVWKKFDFLVYFDHKLWASISGGWGHGPVLMAKKHIQLLN